MSIVTFPLLPPSTRALLRDYALLRQPEYGPEMTRQMIRDGRFALFLDGLDEMPPPARVAVPRCP